MNKEKKETNKKSALNTETKMVAARREVGGTVFWGNKLVRQVKGTERAPSRRALRRAQNC